MSNALCEELIVEILSRLPSQSLLRFRLVSKSLCACISSPVFIQLHTLQSPKKVMIIHKKGYINPKYIYTLHSESKLMSNNPHIGITPVMYPYKNMDIVGSCNGIVCLDDYYKRCFHLWNPSIRRKVTINDRSSRPSSVDGFGFDPIMNDYKILKICSPRSHVYTVKTHTWREIASPTTRFTSLKLYPCVFNGLLHWVVGWKPKDSGRVRHEYILTFDLSSEVFSKIELPEPSWDTNKVAIIKGFLAVISSEHDDSRIWVRRDGASWSLAFRFNANEFKGTYGVLRLITPNDESLCYSCTKGIQVYNLETHVKLRHVKLDDSSWIVDMNMFAESLEFLGMGTSCYK